jgi:hypothetical protein
MTSYELFVKEAEICKEVVVHSIRKHKEMQVLYVSYGIIGNVVENLKQIRWLLY